MLETLHPSEEAVADLVPRKAALLNTTALWAKPAISIRRTSNATMVSRLIQLDRQRGSRSNFRTAIDILAQTDEQTNSVRFRMPQPNNRQPGLKRN